MSNMCKKSHRTILTVVVELFDRYFGLSSPPPPPSLYPSFPPLVLTARLTVCELRCHLVDIVKFWRKVLIQCFLGSIVRIIIIIIFCIHLFETELLVGDTSV